MTEESIELRRNIFYCYPINVVVPVNINSLSSVVREGGKLSVSLPGAAALCTKPVATFLASATSRVETSHCSRLSRDYTVLSLVEIMVLLGQLSYAIKNQLQAPKAPLLGTSLTFRCVFTP